MRLSLLAVICGLCVASCNGKKGNEAAVAVDFVDTSYQMTDSMAGAIAETLPIIYEDELFEDFIYNFSTDASLQLKRIDFPLVVTNGKQNDTIVRKNWKHDELFNLRNYYTLLFDKEEDMELIGDESLDSIQMEWIDIPERVIKQYNFKRTDGLWHLDKIDKRMLTTADNESFLNFFHKFATDSLYQSRMVRRPLKFVTVDPDDDFAVLETTLDINQWFAFKPELPVAQLTIIDYGQRNNGTSSNKILAMKGLDNGFSNLLYFRKKTGKDWELYKFEDTSM